MAVRKLHRSLFTTGKQGGLRLSHSWKEIEKIFTSKRFQLALEIKIENAIWRSLTLIEKEIIKSIEHGNWAKNKPLTTFLKGSNRPLIDSRRMIKSIVKRMTKFNGTVGWRRGDAHSTKGGLDMASLVGMLLEDWSINVTEKMRNFFAAKGVRLKDSTKVLKVRGRDFLTPVLTNEKLKQKIADLFERAIAEAYLMRDFRPNKKVMI